MMGMGEDKVIGAIYGVGEVSERGRGILNQERAWLQRFEYQDTRAFFLSDIYDFLKLFTGRAKLRVT